jgi:nucleoside 2-deoxyribosyltransferase
MSKRNWSTRFPPGTRTLIDAADVVVVRFGDKYRQWNAAFDAGYATARGKALVTLHPPGVSHMLKEVGGRAGSDRNFEPPVESRPFRLVFERVVCARRVLDSE